MSESDAQRERVWRKLDRQELALGALRDLAASLGDTSGSAETNIGTVFNSSKLRVVDVRCLRRHKLAGVWRSEAGPLMLALPEVSEHTETMTGVLTVHTACARRRVVADLLNTTPEPGERARRCSCACGLFEIMDRDGLAAAAAQALRSGPSVWLGTPERLSQIKIRRPPLTHDQRDDG